MEGLRVCREFLHFRRSPHLSWTNPTSQRHLAKLRHESVLYRLTQHRRQARQGRRQRRRAAQSPLQGRTRPSSQRSSRNTWFVHGASLASGPVSFTDVSSYVLEINRNPLQALKATGNALLKAGRHAAAAVAYTEALLFAEAAAADLALQSLLLSNRSHAHWCCGAFAKVTPYTNDLTLSL